MLKLSSDSENILFHLETNFNWFSNKFRWNIENDFWSEKKFLNYLVMKKVSLSNLLKFSNENTCSALTNQERKLLDYLNTLSL